MYFKVIDYQRLYASTRWKRIQVISNVLHTLKYCFSNKRSKMMVMIFHKSMLQNALEKSVRTIYTSCWKSMKIKSTTSTTTRCSPWIHAFAIGVHIVLQKSWTVLLHVPITRAFEDHTKPLSQKEVVMEEYITLQTSFGTLVFQVLCCCCCCFPSPPSVFLGQSQFSLHPVTPLLLLLLIKTNDAKFVKTLHRWHCMRINGFVQIVTDSCIQLLILKRSQYRTTIAGSTCWQHQFRCPSKQNQNCQCSNCGVATVLWKVLWNIILLWKSFGNVLPSWTRCKSEAWKYLCLHWRTYFGGHPTRSSSRCCAWCSRYARQCANCHYTMSKISHLSLYNVQDFTSITNFPSCRSWCWHFRLQPQPTY